MPPPALRPVRPPWSWLTYRRCPHPLPPFPLLPSATLHSLDGCISLHCLRRFQLLSMHSVNERERSYTIDGYLVLQWSDPRLEFGNLSCRDAIALPSYANTDTKLWEPGVQCMETLHESVGGSSGATHIAGESLVISRNGTVLWSRRARYKLLCDTFNFGRMPFDEQFCIATLRSFPYNEELVQLEWPDCASNPVACGGSGQLQPYHSGEWIVTIVDQRTVTEADGHRVHFFPIFISYVHTRHASAAAAGGTRLHHARAALQPAVPLDHHRHPPRHRRLLWLLHSRLRRPGARGHRLPLLPDGATKAWCACSLGRERRLSSGQS